MAHQLGVSPRLRRSPFYDATVRYGASAFTVYNHMLLASAYADVDEYQALVERVAIWDVAVERQVEVVGPDAVSLMKRLVTRNVDKCRVGTARYVLLCNDSGGVLNDPVMLRLADDHFWLSLADRDILLWTQGIALAAGFDVTVREPDVSPLQVQGPRSRDLIESVFGDDIAGQKYYHFIQTELDGVPLVVSRTGWSGEYGYEVFLRDGSRGEWLWERLFTAGEPLGAAPGAPNQIRRIEGGILSYGTDMDDTVNPYELGLDRIVDSPDDFVGRRALATIEADGVSRRLVGLRIDGDPLESTEVHLPVTRAAETVGHLSSNAYSPRFETNLGLAMLRLDATPPGMEVNVAGRGAVTAELPFVVPRK